MITLDMDEMDQRTRKPTRHFKVYRGPWDEDTRQSHSMIRLGGKYLESFGFRIGDIIEVDLEPSRIVIRKVENRN